jgi:hypothetical protein
LNRTTLIETLQVRRLLASPLMGHFSDFGPHPS